MKGFVRNIRKWFGYMGRWRRGNSPEGNAEEEEGSAHRRGSWLKGFGDRRGLTFQNREKRICGVLVVL